MNQPIAMVGCGARAVIGQHIAELSDMRVTHVVDSDPTARVRAQELFGDVEFFADVDDLLKSRKDLAAAIVCSPDHTHADVTVPLLRAGVPVYLEKPMATNVADADRLLRASAASGTLLYVGHNMRHMAVVQLMKTIIDDGHIGKVQAVWCRHFVGNGGDYYFHDWHADRSRSGSLLLQKGVHDIDVIHYLAGATSVQVQGLGALRVYGDVASRRDNSGRLMSEWFSHDNWPPRDQTDLNPIIDVEDLSMIQMRLANGVLASYQQCHFTPDYWRNYTVIGDAGRLENFGDTGDGVVRVWNKRHDYAPEGDIEFPIDGDVGGHRDADRMTMAEFLRVVCGAHAPIVTAADARDAVATAEAGAQSLRANGMTIEVHSGTPASWLANK